MRYVGVAFLVTLATSGCGDGGASSAHADVVDALRSHGLTPRLQHRSSSSVLGVPARVYAVSGGELHVFRFRSDAEARRAAGRVDPGGYSVSQNGGALQVDWLAPPHWFRAGRELAVYLGSDGRVLRALERALGPQFAGPKSGTGPDGPVP